MKLPVIKSSNLNDSKLIKDKYKIVSEHSPSKENKLESFSKKLNRVQEIKIVLSKNFNAFDVDEEFIKDMETVYAEQYLNKLEMLPTKNLINKILSLRPLEKCDFYLTNETVTSNDDEKPMKIVHIYPGACVTNKKVNQSEDDKQNNIKNYLNKNIESSIKLNLSKENRDLKEKIMSIKKNNKAEADSLIYNKEKIDDLLNKNLDDLAELKFFSLKNKINVDLSFENIKKKYIIIKKIEDYQSNERTLNSKGKFYNIGNSISGTKNILNDPKYAFDITEIKNLNTDIIKEVSEPIDVQFELVMKDINYILDNFPLDKFINIDDDVNIYKYYNKETPNRSVSYDNNNNNLYKLKLEKQEDIMKIFKIFHSMDFYRLVCLTLNLLYWIVFGNQNNVQIDKNTKEYLYLKLLSQIDLINSKVSDIKLLSKIFIPLEIIIVRIEADNYLSRKFNLLFDQKNSKNKEKAMIIVNNIITEIFDKHGYMNSFETICGTRDELNKKISKNSLPRFKKKAYGTSNLIEQLFYNDKIDISKNSMENIQQRQKFIMGPKVDFFNSYLQKINNNLKKRNLAPIFTVNFKPRKIADKKAEDIIDKDFKRDLYLSEENENNNIDNQRYIKVEKYMENSVRKFKKLLIKPIHTSTNIGSKTEVNIHITK